MPDEVVRPADQIELVDITPEALRRRLAHGNVYAPDEVDAALSNYFRRGNLTALRELALLWLADQVDAALEKYRAENKITATWEARERVVVAVTGGPESETLVRRASRIASKSSAELMVVHVVRGDGLSGVSAPQMGKVRELATSLGATVHTVVGDDVSDRPAGFRPRDERHPAGVRHVAAIAVGADLRRRHRRGRRAAVRHDRRAHGHPQRRPGPARRLDRLRPRERQVGVLAGRAGRSVGDLRAHRRSARPLPGHRRGERAVLRRRTGGRAARRCRPGRAVGGAVRDAAQLFPHRPAAHLHHLRAGQRGDHRGAAGGGDRGGGPGRRGGQPRPRGAPGVAGGRTARAVRRLGAARRRPGHAAGAGPGDVLPTRGQPAAPTRSRPARSSPVWATDPASTSNPRTPRSRSATTSSGC